VAPPLDLRGRIAVVTGGGSGIGRELVAQLAAAGAHVAACDVRLSAVQRTCREVAKRSPSVRVTAHECDVSDEDAVIALRAEVTDAHDADVVHVLVNNAGVVGGASFVAGDRADWDRTFAVCWTGTYLCTRTFLPSLMAADRGVVINVASVNALWASVGPGTAHTAYSTAKFAIRGFTEALHDDFAVNAPHLSAVLVLPGHVRTGMPAPPRAWRRAFDSMLAGLEPVAAADAAAQILDGVRAGAWRIVVGEDARLVDERVRADPWTAYEH
jgi:NAD(P)-dependent dehydrogenase (short-subunit alcohol dehydrogenase family)